MVQNKHYYLSCLNGVHSRIVNIFHTDAEVKEFETKDQLEEFMKNIRTTDRLTYIPPQDAPPSMVRQAPVT